MSRLRINRVGPALRSQNTDLIDSTVSTEASMRLSSGLFLSACVACLCLSGCSEEDSAAPSAPRPARITVVSPHKLTLVAQGAGRIGSRYVSEVGFEVGGRLLSRDVDTGNIVT